MGTYHFKGTGGAKGFRPDKGGPRVNARSSHGASLGPRSAPEPRGAPFDEPEN